MESKTSLSPADMRLIIDVARESFLILDNDLNVVNANPTFYKNFHVQPEQTENRSLYDLGDGQWNIPELRRLMSEILPERKIVKNYRVRHVFKTIGDRTILLNARQIDTSQLIILAMEDITDKVNLEEKLARYTKGLEGSVDEKSLELKFRVDQLKKLNKSMVGRELKMIELKKEIDKYKKQIKDTANHKND